MALVFVVGWGCLKTKSMKGESPVQVDFFLWMVQTKRDNAASAVVPFYFQVKLRRVAKWQGWTRQCILFLHPLPHAIDQLVTLRQIRKKKSKDFAHETTAMHADFGIFFNNPHGGLSLG